MKIIEFNPVPFHSTTFQCVLDRGQVGHKEITFHEATVDGLPGDLGALLATSDLQGQEATPGRTSGRLLGEVVAEELEVLAELGVIPPSRSIGALLAGDFFVRPELDRRGGMGDVRPVWRAFAGVFRWCCGVAGNHDLFWTEQREFASFLEEEGIEYLDGDTAELDGVSIGGVGGITGNPRKFFRREPVDFLKVVDAVLRGKPAILLLHLPPARDPEDRRASPELRARLEKESELLVVCGHIFRDNPLEELPGGAQVLNVNERVVVLRAAHPTGPAHD